MANIDAEGSIAVACSLSTEASLLGILNGSVSQSFLATGNMVSAPRLSSVVALSGYKVRFTFDQAMKNDSRLIDPTNYFVTPSSSSGVAVYVSSVEPEGVLNPTYVDLTVNEMTGGVGYQGRVNAGLNAPVSRLDIAINFSGNTASFFGEGENPTIVSVEAIGSNRVDITFSEPMLDNDSIRDPTNYIFDNGLTTIAILNVVSNRVELVTSDQVPGIIYNLMIG